MNAPASLGLPKPGPALTFTLLLVGTMSLVQALLVNFAHTTEPFMLLVGDTAAIRHGQIWRLLTAAVLSNPASISDALFTLMGLYFMTPELERRWGGKRLLIFMAASAIAGAVTTTLLDLVPVNIGMLHTREFFGAYAVIAALSCAFALEVPNAVIRLFFFVPVKSAWLAWITLAFAVLAIVYQSAVPAGPFAPIAGWALAMLFAGTPSRVRRVVLRWKMQRLQTGVRKSRSKSGPDLHVVYGGLANELDLKSQAKKTDKRTLN
jgi:membrane associated rhomboid family serine protease